MELKYRRPSVACVVRLHSICSARIISPRATCVGGSTTLDLHKLSSSLLYLRSASRFFTPPPPEAYLAQDGRYNDNTRGARQRWVCILTISSKKTSLLSHARKPVKRSSIPAAQWVLDSHLRFPAYGYAMRSDHKAQFTRGCSSSRSRNCVVRMMLTGVYLWQLHRTQG